MINYKYLFLLLISLFFIGCPSVDRSVPEFPIEQREKEIRALIAEILDTPSYEQKEGQNTLKNAALKRTLPVYYIINEPETLKKAGIPQEIETWITPLREKLSGVPFCYLADALRKTDDSEFEKYQESLNEALTGLNFDMTKDLRNIQIPNIGSNWKAFLESVVERYFIELNLVDKKRILAFVLRNTSSDSNTTQVLLSLISASGPYFQKLMQLLGDFLQKTPEDEQGSDFHELREGLENVKNNLPSIDSHFVNQYIKELESLGVQLKVGDSLGAASVGEVFKAEYWPNGTGLKSVPIVIKLMRPGIEEIAKREEAFFRAKAAQINPAMEASFAQIAKQIRDELDYDKELEKLRKGGQIYGTDESSNIRVVRPIENFPNRKYWMAMEFAQGSTFRESSKKIADSSSMLRTNLEMMAKAILLERFVDGPLIESLFFANNSSAFPLGTPIESKFAFLHGDLHSGNILIFVDERIFTLLDNRKITADNLTKEIVNELLDERDGKNRPYIQLCIVDFGNAHSLSLKHSKALFNLFISAAQISLSVDAFTSSFNELLETLSDIEPHVLEDMKTKVLGLKSVLSPPFDPSNGFKEPYERVGLATDILMDNDIIIPGVIYALVRSLGLVANTYESLKNDARTIGSSFEKLNLGDTLTWTIIRNVAPSVLRGAYGSFAQAIKKYFNNQTTEDPANEQPFSSENAWSIVYSIPTELKTLFDKWWNKPTAFSY